MNNEGIIEAKVDEFTARGQGFTSVDICNSIKVDGTWIRNRDVAAWLRRWTPPVGYYSARITVQLGGGDKVTAAAYLPNDLTPADYADTAQTAMTPKEFEDLHGFDPIAGSPMAVAPSAQADDGSDGGDGSHDAAVGTLLKKMFKWPGAA